jgi:hypothetical protein
VHCGEGPHPEAGWQLQLLTFLQDMVSAAMNMSGGKPCTGHVGQTVPLHSLGIMLVEMINTSCYALRGGSIHIRARRPHCWHVSGRRVQAGERHCSLPFQGAWINA